MTVTASAIAAGSAPSPAALEIFRHFHIELRLIADQDGARSLTHVEAWRLVGDYAAAAKRPRHGPNGGGAPTIRLGGLSGTALKIAVEHADIFEIPGTVIAHLRPAIDRVRAAARARAPGEDFRFALAVRLFPGKGRFDRQGLGSAEGDAADLVGTPEQISVTLLSMIDAGIGEFVVHGEPALAAATIALTRRSLARRREDPGAATRFIQAYCRPRAALVLYPRRGAAARGADAQPTIREEAGTMALGEVDRIQLRAWAEAGIISVAHYCAEVEARGKATRSDPAPRN